MAIYTEIYSSPAGRNVSLGRAMRASNFSPPLQKQTRVLEKQRRSGNIFARKFSFLGSPAFYTVDFSNIEVTLRGGSFQYQNGPSKTTYPDRQTFLSLSNRAKCTLLYTHYLFTPKLHIHASRTLRVTHNAFLTMAVFYKIPRRRSWRIISVATKSRASLVESKSLEAAPRGRRNPDGRSRAWASWIQDPRSTRLPSFHSDSWTRSDDSR